MSTFRCIVDACKDCGSADVGWWVGRYKSNPGAASVRCQECYLQYTRERSYRSGKAAAARQAPKVLGPRERPYNKRWQDIRAAVIAEETHCGICGDPVDKSLKSTHRLGPTVDHIEPLAFGGDAYDRANLRLAHLGCNAREGQKQFRRKYDEAIAEIERLKELLARRVA